MFGLRGILVCSLKMLVFLAIGFCNIDWKALVMQCILLFNLFVSSSLFFLVVVVKLFDYCWKPYSLFSNFVLTVFWCSTSYTVLVVLWSMLMEPVNAPARWRPCACLKSFFGLPRLEKTLNFLKYIHTFDLVLRCGSDIKEGNWLQLLFYFILLVGKLASVILRSFFSPVFQVLDGCFLVLHFDGNVCKWIPKVIWPQMDWFWNFFCLKMASFVDFISVSIEIYKNCSIVNRFWGHQIFSMFSLRGILVCSLKMLVLFSHKIL